MTSGADFEQVMLKLADQWDAEGKIADAAAARKCLDLRRSYYAAKEQLRADDEQIVELIRQLEGQEVDLRQRETDLEKEKLCLRIINIVNYELRRNPLFAWGEILTYAPTEPLPEWVRVYLEGVATSLFELAGEEMQNPKRLTDRVASALQISKKRSNAFEDLRSYEKEIGYANEVDSRTGKRKDVIADAAQEQGFSPSTGSRYLRRMREYGRRVREVVVSFGGAPNDTKQ